MNYDSWLLNQAEYYTAPCEPELDKNGEYSKCENCSEKEECELYAEIHN